MRINAKNVCFICRSVISGTFKGKICWVISKERGRGRERERCDDNDNEASG